MAKRRSRDLTVGLVFALALSIFAIAIMAVGGDSRVFSSKKNFTVVFPSVDGLTVGSPVKMAGVQVGTVSSIRLPTDPNEPGIRVQIGVDESYARRVREDSFATMRILQLLTGEKFVEIEPGSVDSPELPGGSKIPPSAESELFEQAAVTAENLNEITVALKKILDGISGGEGLIGKMIIDPEFGKQGLESLSGTVENLEKLSGDISQGKGFIGRLIYDREFAGKIDDLGRTIERLATLSEQIDLESGALGRLMDEESGKMVDDLLATTAALRKVAESLNSDSGLVGRLLNDPVYSDKLAEDLGRTVANLAEISEKVNSGEGTLGALVNEKVLYDGMEQVVSGVNDSKFARWLLRHYQKKGIKVEDQEKK